MQNILFISLYEPSLYGGHVGGTVILVNDILSVVPEDVNVDLLVYQKQKIKSKLPKNIHFISWSELASIVKKKSFIGSLPGVLHNDYACYGINVKRYEKIIFYPYFCALFNLIDCHAKVYTIGMDSGPMLYLRGFLRHSSMIMKVFCLCEYFQSLYIDKKASTISQKVFTVGNSDAAFYNSVYLSKSYFIHHPVSSLIDGFNPIKWNNNEKLILCLPGGMSRFYVANLLDEIVERLIKRSIFYSDKVSIDFLGKIRYKALKNELISLENSGITVNYTDYADNYEDYISKKHVILLPLAVGAGTKNKALSAMGMGLDVIGTSIAMENVYGVKAVNIANTANDFIKQINIRLKDHKLFGLTEDEIKAFKRYHAASNWREHFWKEVIED